MDSMNKEDFKKALAEANISSMMEFSELTGENYETIRGWGRKIKSSDNTTRTNPIPSWVKSWLENYKNSEKFKVIREIVKEEIS